MDCFSSPLPRLPLQVQYAKLTQYIPYFEFHLAYLSFFVGQFVKLTVNWNIFQLF